MPPAVACAIATIASPAAVTPRGEAPRSGEATRTVKLTFCVARASSAAHAGNSGSSPSGPHAGPMLRRDRKSTRLNSSHSQISHAVFCLEEKKLTTWTTHILDRALAWRVLDTLVGMPPRALAPHLLPKCARVLMRYRDTTAARETSRVAA